MDRKTSAHSLWHWKESTDILICVEKCKCKQWICKDYHTSVLCTYSICDVQNATMSFNVWPNKDDAVLHLMLQKPIVSIIITPHRFYHHLICYLNTSSQVNAICVLQPHYETQHVKYSNFTFWMEHVQHG